MTNAGTYKNKDDLHHGSTIYMHPMLLKVLSELRFGSSKSNKKPLKLDKKDIPIISTLSDFLRCMSEDTQKIFETVFFDESLLQKNRLLFKHYKSRFLYCNILYLQRANNSNHTSVNK